MAKANKSKSLTGMIKSYNDVQQTDDTGMEDVRPVGDEESAASVNEGIKGMGGRKKMASSSYAENEDNEAIADESAETPEEESAESPEEEQAEVESGIETDEEGPGEMVSASFKRTADNLLSNASDAEKEYLRGCLSGDHEPSSPTVKYKGPKNFDMEGLPQ